jgi:hypothetical protein
MCRALKDEARAEREEGEVDGGLVAAVEAMVEAMVVGK